MKVEAIKKFGKYGPGQQFDLPDKTAKLFIKAKMLRSASVVEAVADTPLPEVPEPLAEPQTYETRDMVPEADISPRTGRPRRAYTRRDLKADE